MKIVNVEKIIIIDSELNRIYDVISLFEEIQENSNNENAVKCAQDAVKAMVDFVETINFDVVEE